MGRVVAPCDEETFAREMNRLIFEPETLAAMKANCSLAVKELQWAGEETKLLNVYKELKPANS